MVIKNFIRRIVSLFGYTLVSKSHSFKGIYKKYMNFTMIPENTYCANLKLVAQYVKVEGDIIECGVWRGGMIAGISEILNDKREYHLLDSFEGLPPVQEIDGETAKQWQSNTQADNYYNNCSAEINYANEAMKLTGATYFLHKGWFNEVLPTLKINPIALLRLDGDWYYSTMECLKYLYPHVVKSGLIIIDDYYAWDGCSRAVHDYLSSIKSPSKINMLENVCYIIKQE